jgi:hypothetical protein
MQHPWLPINATLTTALYAPLIPGTRISTQGRMRPPEAVRER